MDAKSSLGIDKSEESIQIATTRYPDQNFLLRDVFEDDLDLGPKNPLVVSIDINIQRYQFRLLLFGCTINNILYTCYYSRKAANGRIDYVVFNNKWVPSIQII